MPFWIICVVNFNDKQIQKEEEISNQCLVLPRIHFGYYCFNKNKELLGVLKLLLIISEVLERIRAQISILFNLILYFRKRLYSQIDL